MIKKIDSINRFGCFQKYIWDEQDLPLFKKVNLIYGNNGSGKTTLSNLFSLFSVCASDKSDILNEYQTKDLSFQITTSNRSYTEKDYDKFDGILYVFNSKFINDHIYDGSKSNMSAFSSKSKITNEVIDDIDNSLLGLVKRGNRLIEWENKLNKVLDEIWTNQKTTFNDNISGKRLTDSPKISDLNTGDFLEYQDSLKKLYNEYVKFENAEDLKENINQIQSKVDDLIQAPVDLMFLGSILKEGVNEKTVAEIKAKVQKITTEIEVLDSDIKGSNWLITGNKLLKNNRAVSENKCPLCNSDIKDIIDTLIIQYDSFFSEKLLTLYEDINKLETTFMSYENIIEINKKLFIDINNFLKPFKYNRTNLYIFNEEKLKEDIKLVLEKLNEKRLNPNLDCKFDVKLLVEFNIVNEALQKSIDELSEFVSIQNKEIDKLLKRDIVSEIKKKVKDLAISTFNKNEYCIFKSSTKINAQIAAKITYLKKGNEEKIKLLKHDREAEVAKLELETKYINIYLEYLGVSDFIVQRDKNKENDNIIIAYKSGVRKKTLKYSLSEGEKTALAFAFFLSKIRAEQIEGQSDNFNNVIIVIDDPISSLDDNRLYHTANLIDTFFHFNDLSNGNTPLQTFLLSHNMTFLKYISNIFYANNNIKDEIHEYYIDPVMHSITSIPNSLKNFTTTYLEKLNDIILYNEASSIVTYNDAKKYIPNYIRIVLESFLSFKFALVKDDVKGRLPGLNFLINKAIVGLSEYDDNVQIGKVDKNGVKKRLTNLKRIADNESHGSIAKIDSHNYISEKELKGYCKDVIQIIEYFDKIHYVKAKSLIK